jgi:hypothetical protein
MTYVGKVGKLVLPRTSCFFVQNNQAAICVQTRQRKVLHTMSHTYQINYEVRIYSNLHLHAPQIPETYFETQK